MESIYIECRNCNTYFKIDKKDCRYSYSKCRCEENLVVIKEKGSNEYEKK
ncbi:Uncharacterised protein [[Clostridium] sordellii]|uniref:Phage protein n=1 Tax=Paraclostridium sordellii TaxID=1505 RepID=A0ABM9RTN9_PARSO|nr:hypothetical protein [Paeniclostridium sordellii]EPZ61790.1 hypothetical protein H477_5964 [[Clostridium] sordellii ATCC 9714] [Paeniclostridium sordellii ATCC 9714]CEJ75446.1 hypothetical protein ATCC9714_PCS200391 (plasmid) [[Clostridium] sordellii] [Paeniclostridium sordellii]CEN67988.1 Uncharacterised protein [[Clostridium] sordellii] [Paeniclostridium sordellii]CEN71271.1 Uncharacterised protein [[Clostridium] sordellii] [Paeniclostridium sordellii]CEO20794.1 Uncharacterised protein [[